MYFKLHATAGVLCSRTVVGGLWSRCDGDDLQKLESELGEGVEVKASEAKLWGEQASNLRQFLSLRCHF